MNKLFFKKVENPPNYKFEKVSCYNCGAEDYQFLLMGEDDLTGKSGTFQFVQCNKCGLAFQQPRLELEQIKTFYDDEYISHRKQKKWGIFTTLIEWTFNKHDRDKARIVRKYLTLNSNTEVLDVGCASGAFVYAVKRRGLDVVGVEPKGLELGSGAMGPHPLDNAWKINETWVGIGFGVERLLMAKDKSNTLGKYTKSLTRLDGVRLNL